jgi:hypothetical protein
MYETEARPVIFANWRRVIFQQLKLWFSTIRKAFVGLEEVANKSKTSSQNSNYFCVFHVQRDANSA